MNVILNTPIVVTLTSGFLVSEEDGVGTIQFTIEEQPVTLSLTDTYYTYDTPFSAGDRVKLIEAYSSLGINSEGVLQGIVIDSTDDKGDVLFDTIYPDQRFGPTHVEVVLADVTSLVRVPLRLLEII